MCSDLVQILPSEERLIFLFVEVDGEGGAFRTFLPQRAGAVPRQGVVPHLVVVGVLSRQDAAPAGAAQRRDCKLHQEKEARAAIRGRREEEMGEEMTKETKQQRRMCNSSVSTF